MNDQTPKKLLLLFSTLILFYVGIAFAAPILLKKGNFILGNAIYEVYGKFCHQRVERSLFLFGEKSFYSVQELKEEAFLPAKSETDAYPEYFGHYYNGNEKIGYKVAICIRDLAMYGAFALFGFLFSFLKIKRGKKIDILIVILLFPIMIDILLQSVVEIFRLHFVPIEFVNSIDKRILTGLFAGLGFAMFFKLLLEKRKS